MTQRTNRRKFLQTATAGATCLAIASSLPARAAAADGKLRIALVGVGERGRGFIKKVASTGQNLVALCDADQWRIDRAGELPPGVRIYKDFRVLLDEMVDSIDAVIIATPHHSQPAISAAAIRRGKHVYCEKPIAHDVGEARAIRELVSKHNVVTQMGNQGVSTDPFRRILEQVEDGAVGEIREAYQWYVADANPKPHEMREPPADPTAIPEGLDWDLYLGPAADRPYDYKYMKWAGWRSFGTGMLGMGGAHSCHMTFNALNLRALWEGNDGKPTTIHVEAECDEVGGQQFPKWEAVRFDVPARGAAPPARIHWFKGLQEDLVRLGAWEKLEKIAGRSLDWKGGWAPTSGSLVVGDKGVVHTNMHNSECALLPLEKFPDQGGPPQRLPHSGSQEREWVDACLGRGPKPFSNFDYAAPVIELLLLGNVCTLLGRPIDYDPVAGKIIGDEDANRALRPPRRVGWSV
jgi:hypothetical protein